jgi:hypothetical protein
MDNGNGSIERCEFVNVNLLNGNGSVINAIINSLMLLNIVNSKIAKSG